MTSQSLLKSLLAVIALVLTLAACDQAPDPESAKKSSDTAQSAKAITKPSSDSPASKYQVGERLSPNKNEAKAEAKEVASTAKNEAETLEWDALIPPEYDPMVILEGVDLNTLDDSDPKASAIMDELQAAWANAPVVPALDGKRVRVPGFIVPLEGDAETVSEMLLVPYFGACIHVPPPPSNQIIHVPKMPPISRDTAYDAVWVEGVIHTQGKVTDAGSAGYTIEADSVVPYE